MKKFIKNFKKKINHLKNQYLSTNQSFVVFIYHRVLPYSYDDISGSTVSLKNFIDQINYIKKNFNILNFNDLSNDQINKKIKAVITFDDGYVDNYKYAYPILKKLSIPAIFFIPTYYLNNKIIWDRYLLLLIQYSNMKNKKFFIKDKDNNIIFFKKNNIDISKKKFWKLINYLKNNNIKFIEEVLENIRTQLNFKEDINEDNYCMSEIQIKELYQNNFTIGSHSHYHLSMQNYSSEKVCQELSLSKKIIENITKDKSSFFAYPFGSINDFSFDHFKEINKIGFSDIFLNINGINKFHYKNYGIKRIILDNDTNLKYILG